MMNEILSEIFEMEYEEIFPTSPQCKTLKRQAYPMYEQIHQTLGVDFADHLSQLHGDMEELSGRLLFQRCWTCWSTGRGPNFPHRWGAEPPRADSGR